MLGDTFWRRISWGSWSVVQLNLKCAPVSALSHIFWWHLGTVLYHYNLCNAIYKLRVSILCHLYHKTTKQCCFFCIIKTIQIAFLYRKLNFTCKCFNEEYTRLIMQNKSLDNKLIWVFPKCFHWIRWIQWLTRNQEIIPVGCVVPACQLYVFQYPPDVNTGGSSSEQVWTDLQS